MVSSIAGFVLSFNTQNQSDLPKKYNGFKLNQNPDQTWTLEYREREIKFINHPKQLEYLSVNKEVLDTIKSSKEMILLFDPNSDQAFLQGVDTIRYFISRQATYFGRFVNAGITNQSEKYNLPIYSCDDQITSDKVLLKLTQEASGEIKEENNCIIISGTEFEIVSKLDYISYLLLGVMK